MQPTCERISKISKVDYGSIKWILKNLMKVKQFQSPYAGTVKDLPKSPPYAKNALSQRACY